MKSTKTATKGCCLEYRAIRAESYLMSLATCPGQPSRTPGKLHPKLQHAQSDALRSQLQTLERELREYDELKSGRRKTLTYGSFDELPKALVQARIARGWTQKDWRTGTDMTAGTTTSARRSVNLEISPNACSRPN
jgi:hypothetical protein